MRINEQKIASFALEEKERSGARLRNLVFSSFAFVAAREDLTSFNRSWLTYMFNISM